MEIKKVIEAKNAFFKEGDVVKLKGHSRSIVGRIKYIGLSFIEIDCSERFKSILRQEKLGDYYSIEHYEESEE